MTRTGDGVGTPVLPWNDTAVRAFLSEKENLI